MQKAHHVVIYSYPDNQSEQYYQSSFMQKQYFRTKQKYTFCSNASRIVRVDTDRFEF